MNASVFSLDGKKVKDIELPKVFESELHPELIKRAVLSMQSAAKQPKGAKPMAGMSYTGEYRGSRGLPSTQRTINIEKARLPRSKNRRTLVAGRVVNVPQAVSGPKAHAPKAEKRAAEKINKKERKAALKSAIAATADPVLVRKRHRVDAELKLPIVVVDDFEKISKTRDAVKVLDALKLGKDLSDAKSKSRRRAGKGKRRGRKKKQKKTLLIVTGKNSAVYKAARNLPGVDVCSVRNLNAALLAPGCGAGRLTVWSEAAINALKERK